MTIPKYMAGLGFMDMELFNLSLLAKQTWSHESLSTCIFHVVYFQERRGSVPYHLKHRRKFAGNRPHRVLPEAPSRIATTQLLSPISKHLLSPSCLDSYCTDRTDSFVSVGLRVVCLNCEPQNQGYDRGTKTSDCFWKLSAAGSSLRRLALRCCRSPTANVL
jgi:hypothetical protein